MTKVGSTHNAARQVLAATSISYTVVLLDASIVNVALENISHTLQSGVAGLLWVVNAYTLVFASLLMMGGTLGDKLGPKRVYATGLSVFVLASMLCGCATTVPALVAARGLQGIGSAMLVPCSLALINNAYRVPSERAGAVSVWMACGGAAMASGPLIGGLLIGLFGWRSIFFVNVPIGIIGIRLTLLIPSQGTSRSTYFDLRGQVSATTALGLLIAVLIEGPTLGWRSAPILAGIAMSAIAGVAFLLIEANVRNPMLPLEFFRSAIFSGSTFVSMVSALIFYGMLFSFSLYFQSVRTYSPLATGLALLPMTGMVAVGGLTSSRISRRLGGRSSMCIAFGLYAAGAFGMMASKAASPYWLTVAPMLAIGLASGFISPAATSPALGTVDTDRVAVAAAVLNSARQSGSALGVSIFGTFITSLADIRLAMLVILTVVCVLSSVAALVWWETTRLSVDPSMR